MQKTVSTIVQTANGDQCSATGPTVLSQVAAGTAEGTRAVRPGVFCPVSLLHEGAVGAKMVVGLSVCLKRQDNYVR